MAAATTSTRATSSLMSQLPSQSNTTCNNNHNECCMCGDFGLSSELYRCKICRFRSQHRYCSHLYPKADSYRVCNWCLIQKDVGHITTTPTQRLSSNSPNPSPPYKHKHKHKENIKHSIERLDPRQASDNNNNNNTNKMMKNMKINSPPSTAVDQNHNICSPGTVNKCRRPPFQSIGSPTKKLRSSPEGMASPSTRKRIVANHGVGGQKLIRRTKSDEMSNRNKTSGTTKHVFRNKVVRRYKNLDEVSC